MRSTLSSCRQYGLKKFLLLKKLKILYHALVINDLNDEETVGTFYEKYLQKTKKTINYM